MNTPSRRALRRALASAVLAGVAAWPLLAQGPAERPDYDAIYRIKAEGLQHSKVMELESYLTDVYGPRLTGSPNLKEAAAWAEKTMEAWGLANVHVETWPFGRGWQNNRFVALAVAPRAYPLIGFVKAWTPGTKGAVTAEAIMAVINSEEDFDQYHGRLAGKFVLTAPAREVLPLFEAPAHRYSDAELADLARQPDAARRRRAGGDPARRAFEQKKMKFFVDERVAALIEPGQGSGGTFFIQAGGSPDAKAPPVAPQVVLAAEHYGRIARTLEKNIPVTLQFDIDNKFYDADLNAFNLIAEIPGRDKAGEVVMLGAHLDSWQAGTGATDNAAGSAVMMEAMRILKISGLPLRRTVRLGLWSGEEEGLLGSKAYVRQHFGDPDTMALKPEQAPFDSYFNLDNGTGAIRGVYLQGNEAVAPIFTAWMEPFKNMGMTTLTIRSTGGTDHLSFDAVGLPAFQFIQDPLEYDTRSHHSNMDEYERVQANDMMQNAVIVAAFVYDAANRDEKLPRKPPNQPTASASGS